MNLSEEIEAYLERKMNPGKGQWINLDPKDYTENIMAIIQKQIDKELISIYYIQEGKEITNEQEEKRKNALKEFKKILK